MSISQAEKALSQAVGRWNEAANPLSPESIAAVYTQDALFFGGRPDHYVGRASVREYFETYRDILASIKLAIRDVHFAEADHRFLLAQGVADFTFGLLDGRTTFASLRATLALRRPDADWMICLHHFSPPPEVSPVPQ